RSLGSALFPYPPLFRSLGGGRAALALVLRAGGGAAVGRLRGAGQTEQAQLPDLHPGPQGDGQVRDIGELERDVPAEAGIDEAGGRVGEEAESPERRLPLEPP